jgi:hypothetical protein
MGEEEEDRWAGGLTLRDTEQAAVLLIQHPHGGSVREGRALHRGRWSASAMAGTLEQNLTHDTSTSQGGARRRELAEGKARARKSLT